MCVFQQGSKFDQTMRPATKGTQGARDAPFQSRNNGIVDRLSPGRTPSLSSRSTQEDTGEKQSSQGKVRISIVREHRSHPMEKPNYLKKGLCIPIASTFVHAIANPCISQEALQQGKGNRHRIFQCTPTATPTDTPSTSDIQQIFSRSSDSSLTSPETSECDDSLSDDSCMSQLTADAKMGRRSPSEVTRILRDSWTSDSRPKPPPSCDLIVLIGKECFFYSSGILKGSSHYLNDDKSVTRDVDGRYYISFPHHSAEEWRPFVGFVQSHLVGASELSWNIFPSVLPWFVELQMEGLLRESDSFLLHSTIGYQLNKKENRTLLSVPNVLLIINLAFSLGLESTKARAQCWLKDKLEEYQLLSQPSDSGSHQFNGPEISLNWSLEDLQLLSELLVKFETLRDFVWESSIIMYLPNDLCVADSYELVGNMLFPYLLREGMMQVVMETTDCSVISVDEQSKQSSRSPSPTPTTASDSTLPTHHLWTTTNLMAQDTLHSYLQTTLDTLNRFQKIQQNKRQDSHQRWKGNDSPRATKGRSDIDPVATEQYSRPSDDDRSSQIDTTTVDNDNYEHGAQSLKPLLNPKRFAC